MKMEMLSKIIKDFRPKLNKSKKKFKEVIKFLKDLTEMIKNLSMNFKSKYSKLKSIKKLMSINKSF